MAITACFAKLLTSSACLLLNGRTSWRTMVDCADQLALLEHRHGQNSCARHRAWPRRWINRPFRRGIGEADGLLHADDERQRAANCGLKRPPLPHELGICRRDVEFCRRAECATS